MISLVYVGIFVFFSALFSGLETGLISVNRIRLHSRLETGNSQAKLLEWLIRNSESAIGAILVGVNICDVSAVIQFSNFVFQTTGGSNWTPLIVTGVMTPVALLFSTLLPKIIFREFADIIMYPFSYVLLFFTVLLYPFQFVFVRLVKVVLGFFGFKKKNSLFSKEEFHLLVDMTADKGLIKENERDFIESIMNFKNVKAHEIMIPLVRMTCVEENDSVEVASALMLSTRHNRIPVFRMRVDTMIGYVDNKGLIEAKSHDRVGNYVHPGVFVHDLMPVNQVLMKMRQEKAQMAFVVDEYGGVAGVITNQDIIAELLGELVDIREQWIEKTGETLVVNGMLNIDDLNDELNLKIEKQDFETVAGFLLSRMGKIPKEGDKIDEGRYTFEVSGATPVRIKRVKIYPKKRKEKKLREKAAHAV